MRLVTPETAADYLRASGRVPEDHAIDVRELSGGVSNLVLRIEVEGQPPFVLKQCREQLRTKIEWISRLDRIWTERAALRLLAEVLPGGTVPTVLFEDRENYLYAMTCAPDDAVVWKALLLSGTIDPRLARLAGTILGTIHNDLAGHPTLRERFADTELFDQLRVDPYYRQIAKVHPDLKARLDALIASMPEAPRKTFVHADFSPKNMLVHEQSIVLVDFETAHAGDPAFDLGFFLTHLLLKAFRASVWNQHEAFFKLTWGFWSAYLERADPDPDLIPRAIQHTAACTLARIDGKSPVDYLDQLDPASIRRFARSALTAPPSDWNALLDLAASNLYARS